MVIDRWSIILSIKYIKNYLMVDIWLRFLVCLFFFPPILLVSSKEWQSIISFLILVILVMFGILFYLSGVFGDHGKQQHLGSRGQQPPEQYRRPCTKLMQLQFRHPAANAVQKCHQLPIQHLCLSNSLKYPLTQPYINLFSF